MLLTKLEFQVIESNSPQTFLSSEFLRSTWITHLSINQTNQPQDRMAYFLESTDPKSLPCIRLMERYREKAATHRSPTAWLPKLTVHRPRASSSVRICFPLHGPDELHGTRKPAVQRTMKKTNHMAPHPYT